MLVGLKLLSLENGIGEGIPDLFYKVEGGSHFIV
jgi:hypothetical protein